MFDTVLGLSPEIILIFTSCSLKYSNVSLAFFLTLSFKTIKAIIVPNGAEQGRKFFDKMTEFAVQECEAKGLAWTKFEKDGTVQGGIAKFINEEAKANTELENAKNKLDTVEFITRRVSNDDLRIFYNKLYSLSENTCACPSLAYVLFYPELVANRVPYFMAGNEPVQMLGLYYNHMAPKFVYSLDKNKPLLPTNPSPDFTAAVLWGKIPQ